MQAADLCKYTGCLAVTCITMLRPHKGRVILITASFFSISINIFNLIFDARESQQISIFEDYCVQCENQLINGYSMIKDGLTANSSLGKRNNFENLVSPSHGDRIQAQLKLETLPLSDAGSQRALKKILVIDGFPLGVYPGDLTFKHHKCSAQQCVLTDNIHDAHSVDAIIFQGNIGSAEHNITKRPQQIWIYYQLESPVHTGAFYQPHRSFINWTATYRRDSTIVTPYAKYVPYTSDITSDGVPKDKSSENYANGKTKDVAWFVSNCMASNNRMEYVKELQRYISVDIYGECGSFECNRRLPAKCFNVLKKQYKFYLAFENSNCKDYITEKFFVNSLVNNVVPVVLGAKKEDYLQVAPPDSFIHVDDFQSPKHLSEYLHKLRRNNSLYNEYFKWKKNGRFVKTKFWCRLCGMLHHMQGYNIWYNDIETWWSGSDICQLPR